jgi:hypothetical protein
MNALSGFLWLAFYKSALPTFEEAVCRETEANNLQNHATHRVLDNPHNATWDAFIEACDVQIAETQLARAVAVSMRYPRRVAA